MGARSGPAYMRTLVILNIANTLPQLIAPLSAPAVLAVSRADCTLLFAVAGAVVVRGAAVLGTARERPLVS